MHRCDGRRGKQQGQIQPLTAFKLLDVNVIVAVVVFFGAKSEDRTNGVSSLGQAACSPATGTLQLLTASDSALFAAQGPENKGIVNIMFICSGVGWPGCEGEGAGIAERMNATQAGPMSDDKDTLASQSSAVDCCWNHFTQHLAGEVDDVEPSAANLSLHPVEQDVPVAEVQSPKSDVCLRL